MLKCATPLRSRKMIFSQSRPTTRRSHARSLGYTRASIYRLCATSMPTVMWRLSLILARSSSHSRNRSTRAARRRRRSLAHDTQQTTPSTRRLACSGASSAARSRRAAWRRRHMRSLATQRFSRASSTLKLLLRSGCTARAVSRRSTNMARHLSCCTRSATSPPPCPRHGRACCMRRSRALFDAARRAGRE